MKNLLLLITLTLPFYQISASEFNDFTGEYMLIDGQRGCEDSIDINVRIEHIVTMDKEYNQKMVDIKAWTQGFIDEFSFYTNMENINGRFFMDGDVITSAKSKISLHGNQLEISSKGIMYLTHAMHIPRKIFNYKITMTFNNNGEMSFMVKGRGTKNRKCEYRR